MAGRSPWSPARPPASGDAPYSMRPGRTQSRWVSGAVSTAAELARLEGGAAPPSAASASSKRAAWRAVAAAPPGSSAAAKWLMAWSGFATPGRAASARHASGNSDGENPSRCIPVSTLTQSRTGGPADRARTIATCSGACATASIRSRASRSSDSASRNPPSTRMVPSTPARRRASASSVRATASPSASDSARAARTAPWP